MPDSEDCSQTEYGCCPDGVSVASRPDFDGCQQKDAVPHGYCVETEFGCCRDGVTAARGPFGRGCPDVPCYVCVHDRMTHLLLFVSVYICFLCVCLSLPLICFLFCHFSINEASLADINARKTIS